MTLLTTLPTVNKKRGLSIEYSHTMRRRSFVRGTTDGRERTQTMRHAFGIGVEQGGTGECGRNCGSESSKDSKDSGELHDK